MEWGHPHVHPTKLSHRARSSVGYDPITSPNGRGRKAHNGEGQGVGEDKWSGDCHLSPRRKQGSCSCNTPLLSPGGERRGGGGGMLVPVHIPSHPNASKGQGGTRMDQPNRAQSSVLLGAPAESRLMCTCIPPYGRVQGRQATWALAAVPVLRNHCRQVAPIHSAHVTC